MLYVFVEGGEKMLIKKAKFVEEIWNGIFKGNNNQCAKALGIEPSQLLNFVTNAKAKAGAKMLGGFAVLCIQRNLDFWAFIILPKPSTAVDEISA